MAPIYLAFGFMYMVLPMTMGIRLRRHVFFWVFTVMYALLFNFVPSLVALSSHNPAEALGKTIGKLPIIVSENTIYTLLLFGSAFYTLTLVGYIVAASSLVRRSNMPARDMVLERGNNGHDYQHLMFLTVLCAVLSLLGSIGKVFASGMKLSELLHAGRFSHWSTRNTLLSLISSYLEHLAAPALYLSILFLPNSNIILPVISGVVSFFISTYVFGSRVSTLVIVSAVVVALLTRQEESTLTSKKLWKQRISTILVMLLGLYIAIIWQYVRYSRHTVYSMKDLYSLLILNIPDAIRHSLYNGDLIYFFQSALTALEVFPQMHSFLYGTTYARLLLFFIPHSLAPHLKPEETQRIFARVVDPVGYSRGATLPPSILGDAYINFGRWGIIIGFFMGVLLAVCDHFLSQPRFTAERIAIGSAGFGMIFLMLRGTMNGVYPVVFIWLFFTLGKLMARNRT